MKRESEKHSSDVFDNPSPPSNGEPLNLRPCFLEDADGNNARYETNCIDEYVNRLKTVSIEVEAAGSVRELDTELLAASDTESQSTESVADSDSDTESQSTEGTENEIFDESDSRAGSPDIEIVPLEEETHQEL